MTTLKEIHDSAKILNPWIPALSSSHCAFKDTNCIGYSAGCRSEVQRVQVEVKVQDTTGREASASFGNMPDGRGQGLLPKVFSQPEYTKRVRFLFQTTKNQYNFASEDSNR